VTNSNGVGSSVPQAKRSTIGSSVVKPNNLSQRVGAENSRQPLVTGSPSQGWGRGRGRGWGRGVVVGVRPWQVHCSKVPLPGSMSSRFGTAH
jgi:hypothetical protein